MLRSLASSSGWLVAGVALALSSMASSLGGCATGAVADGPSGVGGDPYVGGTGGSGGGGGSGGSGGIVQATLNFTEPEPLSLDRMGSYTLVVQTIPPGSYTVRFALLPGPDSTLPGDAALSATDVATDLDGRASVELTAPSAPTTFVVRASLGNGAFATREVTVEKTGRANLRVERVYENTLRPVTRWFATAVPNQPPNQPCTMVPDGPFDDNLDWTEGPPDPETIVELLNVRADTQLVVVVRIEHFAWGCATIPGVVEGVDNHVRVAVTNVPIQLVESEVSVSLDLSTFQEAFQIAMEPAITATLAELDAGGDDVSALLDRMEAESDSDATAFGAARTSGGWDAVVSTAVGTGASTALRAPLGRWIRAGLANTSGGRFIGTLGAVAGDDAEAARLTLQTVAGQPPDALGVSADNDATWYSSSPEDDVFFGTTLALDPSVLLLTGALAPARTEVTGADTVAEALASLLSCDTVATELVSHGTAAQVSFSGCNQSCTRALCESALATLVSELEERDESEASSLQIAASTVASVGANAELAGFDGTWVGSLVVEGTPTAVGGTALAPAP